MTDEAWIEQSLAQLEALEAKKAQHEEAGEAVPAELDEEIAALYAALETAAADDDEEAPADPAPAAAPAPAPEPAPAVDDSPFAAPAASPAPAPAVEPVMAASMDSYDDDEFKPKGKGGLIGVVAVVLLAAGGGGYWYMTQQKKPEAAPAPQGEAKVITASSVPEDTQEPQAAKGGSADKTPGTEIPEGGTQPKRSGNGGGGGGKKRSRPKKKDDGRKVKINSDDRDPLSGI